jgi:hypothetical protein
LFDVLSQKKYHLPNFDFATIARVKKLTNPNMYMFEQPDAADAFFHTNYVGGFTNTGNAGAVVNYAHQNNRYKMEVRISPSDTGVFCVKFEKIMGLRSSQSNLPQALAPNEPGVRRIPILKQLRYTFNNGNTHFNIYKQHCKPADPNEATNWVESKATYTFVVK